MVCFMWKKKKQLLSVIVQLITLLLFFYYIVSKDTIIIQVVVIGFTIPCTCTCTCTCTYHHPTTTNYNNNNHNHYDDTSSKLLYHYYSSRSKTIIKKTTKFTSSFQYQYQCRQQIRTLSSLSSSLSSLSQTASENESISTTQTQTQIQTNTNTNTNNNIVWIIDVENVRGKTGFALTHETFLYGIQLWIQQQQQQNQQQVQSSSRTSTVRSSVLSLSSNKHNSRSTSSLLSSNNLNPKPKLFGNVILVIDHGNDTTKLYNKQYGYSIVFSGPSSTVKADDVIVNDVLPFLLNCNITSSNTNTNTTKLQINVITSDRQLINRCYNVINNAMTKSFLMKKQSSTESIQTNTNNKNNQCMLEIISPLVFVTTIENLLIEQVQQQDEQDDVNENNNNKVSSNIQQQTNSIQNQLSSSSTTIEVEPTTIATTTTNNNTSTSNTSNNNTSIRQTIIQIGSELLETEYYLLVHYPTTTTRTINKNNNNNLSRKQRSLLSSYYTSTSSSSSSVSDTTALSWMSNKHRKEIIQRRTILLQQLHMYNNTTHSDNNTNIVVLVEDIMKIISYIRETNTIPTNKIPYDVNSATTSNENSSISLTFNEYNTLLQRYIQAKRNNYSIKSRVRGNNKRSISNGKRSSRGGSFLGLGQPYKETTLDRIYLAEQLRLKLLVQQIQQLQLEQQQVQQYPSLLFAKMYCNNVTDPSSSISTGSSSGIDTDSSSSTGSSNDNTNDNKFLKESINNNSISSTSAELYNNNKVSTTDPVISRLPGLQNNNNNQSDLFQLITYDVVISNTTNNSITSGINENMYIGSSSSRSSTSTMTTRRSRKVPGRLQQQRQQRSSSSLHVLPFLRSSNSKLFLSKRLDYDDTDSSITTIVNNDDTITTILPSERVTGKLLDVSSLQSSFSSSSSRRSRRVPGRMKKQQTQQYDEQQREGEDIESGTTISLDTKTQMNSLSTRILKRMNTDKSKIQQEDVLESTPLYVTGKRLKATTHLLPNIHPLRIVVISDTHGFEQQFTMPLPIGDILLHVGDYAIDRDGTATERTSCILFDTWLSQQPHPIKIVIRGNHDPLHYNFPLSNAYYITTPVSCRIGQYKFAFIPHMSSSTYRHSSSSTLRQRRRSSGSTQGDRREHVVTNNILLDNNNRDCDVVVSHIPPKELYVDRCTSGRYAGSKSLRTSFETMASKNGQVPFLLLCGHIHEGRGIVKDYNFASKKQQQQQQQQVQVQTQVPSRNSGVGFLPGGRQQQVKQQEQPNMPSTDKSKEELENARYKNLLTSTTIINTANANPGIARSIDYNPTIVQLGIVPNNKNNNDNEDDKTSIDNESAHIAYNDYDNDDNSSSNNKRDNSQMLLLKRRHKRRVQVMEMDGQYTYINQRNDAFFPPSGSLQSRRLLVGTPNSDYNSIEQVLLAVDLGLRTGICLYTDTGKILYYAHYNFENEDDLRTSIVQLLDEWESNIRMIARTSKSRNDSNSIDIIRTKTTDGNRTPSEKKLYIRRIVIEGHDKVLKKVWNEIAIHTGRLLIFIQPEEWRNDLLITNERQSGESSKIASIYLAQRIISDYYYCSKNNVEKGTLFVSNDVGRTNTTMGSTFYQVPAKVESDDLAESILLGFYVARRLQWITNTDPPINRLLEK